MLVAKLLSVPAAPPTLTFGAGASSATDGLSYTFSLSIGAADANRRVIVGVVYRRDATTSPAFPTVTVAGQACTRVDGIMNDTSTSNTFRIAAAIYITDAAVTTGTTASVVISYASGSNMTRGMASTYSIVKPTALVQEFSDTASGAPTATITSTKTVSMVGVAVLSSSVTTSISSTSITGEATVDFDSGTVDTTGAYESATVTGSGTITFTTSGSGTPTSRAVVVLYS